LFPAAAATAAAAAGNAAAVRYIGIRTFLLLASGYHWLNVKNSLTMSANVIAIVNSHLYCASYDARPTYYYMG